MNKKKQKKKIKMVREISKQTGLPIDFQIQRIKEANAEFKTPRSHVGNHDYTITT